jgi:sulfate adenylyltransferase subunit 1 (EFTu-like GTPase family)
VAILLVDARQGVREQTERHARIARLLGISTFVLAVNKMDLVDFDRGVFERISGDFARLVDGAALHAIPISALDGDNVIASSARTPWFSGPSLLAYLETVEVDRVAVNAPFRFPVQLVLRPTHDFRGYAGRLASGRIRAGDTITVWPSGLTTRVARIVTWEGDLDEAFAPMSVTLVLEDEIDVSRGEVFTRGPIHVGRRFAANVVWMDERPLDPRRPYLLKHTTRVVTAEVDRQMALNDIAAVSVTTATPIVFDSYASNRTTGSFVLIDPSTNFTAGAGMITHALAERAVSVQQTSASARIAQAARAATTDAEAVEAVRRMLEEVLT